MSVSRSGACLFSPLWLVCESRFKIRHADMIEIILNYKTLNSPSGEGLLNNPEKHNWNWDMPRPNDEWPIFISWNSSIYLLGRFTTVPSDDNMPCVCRYIDQGRNPQLYTKECLERALARNEQVKGKIDTMTVSDWVTEILYQGRATPHEQSISLIKSSHPYLAFCLLKIKMSLSRIVFIIQRVLPLC